MSHHRAGSCPNTHVSGCPQGLERCGALVPHAQDLLRDEDQSPPDPVWATQSVITTLQIRRQERRKRVELVVLPALLFAWFWLVSTRFAVPGGSAWDVLVNYVVTCASTAWYSPDTLRELVALWFGLSG